MMKINNLLSADIYTSKGIADVFPFSSSVIALGTFDGVHIAHKSLIEHAVKLKAELSAESVGVWCFDESPAVLLHGESRSMLTSTAEKIALLLKYGADFVAVAKFDDFRTTDAEDFAKNILREKLKCIGTICGFNHRFGYMGMGNPKLLKDIFGDGSSITVSEVTLDGERVSSTAIREHLRQGELEKAGRMLGRPIYLSSTVISGKQLGRKLGFPTANMTLPSGYFSLRHGVYATRCILDDGRVFPGISNIGSRPSIMSGDDHAVNCETYIFGLSEELYGKSMTIEFCSFIRDEMKFSSLDKLTEMIEKDKKEVLIFFENNAHML